MNIFHYFFFILLNEIFSSNNNIYRIPFGLFKQEQSYFFGKSEKESNIINNIVDSGKYINLSIGTPPQIMPFEIDSNSQTFSASNELFNKNASSTYEQISSREININFEVCEKGFNSKDIINLDNNIKKKITFILGTKFNSQKNNNFGVVGLQIPYIVQNEISPFFQSLKDAQLITSFVWTLKFFDNISLIDQLIYNEEKDKIIGEFIFGDEPSRYENDELKYNDKEFFKIPPLTTKGHIDWDLEFSNIYLTFRDRNNNSKIDFLGEKNAEIVINFSFMLGPNYFFEFIKSNFFSEYISNRICLEKTSDYIYQYIECDYGSSFKVDSFPDITFEHAGFESSFNLTYKDLFIVDKKNNKYIFLIFTKAYFSNWVLGTVFLRKFQFVFNADSKTIGYYRPIIQLSEEDNNKNLMDLNGSRTVKTIIIFILVIIFSFVLVFFGMVIQRKFFSKYRKIRANELEDNFRYESRSDDEKKLEINDDKKIIKEDNEKNIYFSI